jgi:hypothetical protein
VQLAFARGRAWQLSACHDPVTAQHSSTCCAFGPRLLCSFYQGVNKGLDVWQVAVQAHLLMYTAAFLWGLLGLLVYYSCFKGASLGLPQCAVLWVAMLLCCVGAVMALPGWF